jgi:hypothetical protein
VLTQEVTPGISANGKGMFSPSQSPPEIFDVALPVISERILNGRVTKPKEMWLCHRRPPEVARASNTFIISSGIFYDYSVCARKLWSM